MHSAMTENIMEHSQQVAVVAHALATISNVYFGAYDLSGNGCVQLSEMIGRTLNHELTIQGGVLNEQCSQILSDYFKSKRS